MDIIEKKYDVRSLYNALNNNNTKIIAEIKKASPSKGIIQQDFQPLKIALEYFNGGASAISILTDEKFFQDLVFPGAPGDDFGLPLLGRLGSINPNSTVHDT